MVQMACLSPANRPIAGVEASRPVLYVMIPVQRMKMSFQGFADEIPSYFPVFCYIPGYWDSEGLTWFGRKTKANNREQRRGPKVASAE